MQQAHTLTKDGTIRRQSIDDGYTQLQIGNDGVIREASGPVSDRISNPTRMRNNYERSYGKLAEGHQIHHLIPDAVVQDNPLMQPARQRGYDLDKASNLISLPSAQEFTKPGNTLIHFGSHPKWNKYVNDELNDLNRRLDEQYGSAEQIPKNVLEERLHQFEQRMRREIQDTELGIEGGWIQRKPDGTLKLSQAEQSPQLPGQAHTCEATNSLQALANANDVTAEQAVQAASKIATVAYLMGQGDEENRYYLEAGGDMATVQVSAVGEPQQLFVSDLRTGTGLLAFAGTQLRFDYLQAADAQNFEAMYEIALSETVQQQTVQSSMPTMELG